MEYLGLNPARGAVLQHLVQEASASIVCLVESKLQVVDQRSVSAMLGTRFDAHISLPTMGTAGGIIVVLDSSVISVQATRVVLFSVTI